MILLNAYLYYRIRTPLTNKARSMSTYHELKEQADELLRQAEELRADERNRVIQEVRQTVQDWSITLTELGIKAGKSADKRNKAAIKYAHPETGKTWSGRVKTPGWLRAEIESGNAKENFLVA
jgi:DNA-binding protein H-NS